MAGNAYTPPDGAGREPPEKSSFNITNIKDLEKAAKEVLEHINHNKELKVDNFVHGFILSVHEVARSGNLNALNEVREALQRIQQDTTHLRQCVSNIENKTEQSNTHPASGTTESATTPGEPHTELAADCEVTVKIRDIALREKLRQGTSADVVKMAERSREKAAKQAINAELAETSFIAARMLPSGDICMRARNAAGVGVLEKHADGWVKVFGADAYVRLPTWGVVAHGIPIKSMDLFSPEAMRKTATQLQASNQHTWGQEARILHLGWLVRPSKNKREGSIVIEFSSPVVANRAVDQGAIWESQAHSTTLFCKEARSKLCRKCQKPGHVHVQCPNNYTCGTCAARHPTWECSSKRGEVVTPRCANCGGEHRASSSTCAVRKQVTEQAKMALLQCEQYHRVPARFESRSHKTRREPMNSGTASQPASQVFTFNSAPAGQERAPAANHPLTPYKPANMSDKKRKRISLGTTGRPRGRPAKKKNTESNRICQRRSRRRELGPPPLWAVQQDQHVRETWWNPCPIKTNHLRV